MKKVFVLFWVMTVLLLVGVLWLGADKAGLRASPVSPTSFLFGSGNRVGEPGSTVQALASGDLDNDGDVDLVSAGEKINGWENDGSPFTHTWALSTLSSPGVTSYALVPGDFDNDGDLDIASGSAWSAGYEVQVWQNDGTPFDATWIANGAGNADAVLVLVSGDLDGDGYLDLVSGDDGAALMAWRNDHTPFAGTWTSLYVGSASTDATALAIGDLDNDGDLDLVSGNAANRVSAWENDGTPFSGAWSQSIVFTATDGIESLLLADVDADGDLDILAGCGAVEDYELTSWQNDGDPFAGTWTRHDIGDKDLGTVYALDIADFDVDGDLDLASGAQMNAAFAEVQGWENNGSPFAGLWGSAPVAETTAGVRALTVADLDRDGDADLIAATDVVTAWPNDRATGSWSAWTEGVQPLPTDSALGVAVTDFDHDGKTDLAAGTGAAGIHIWKGDGGYTWTLVTAGVIPASGVWPAVAWGQINHADEVDLAAASTGSGVRAWLATQDGWVWEDASAGLPTTGDYNGVALAHIDHDGLHDLLASGKSAGVRIWKGTGAAGAPDWNPANVLSNTLDFCDLAVGDINHDGNLDVAGANCGNSQGVPIWLALGAFGFDPSSSPITTNNYEAVALGDLNNDGDLDLVAAPSGGGGTRTWLGDGGSTWTYQGAISPTLAVLSLDLGDFDNDGYLDILAGLQNNGVRVWKNDGGAGWIAASTGLATANPYRGVTFGRIDADATLDVVGAGSSGTPGVRVWTAVEPPPGGWAGFQPATNPPYVWERSLQVTCTVQVVDVGSGLDVSSAHYRFSRDGGASWIGDWLTATVSGVDGTTAPQVMTATNVPFNQDSETLNAIQFRIADLSGLTSDSPIYYVAIDGTPPANPSDLTSPDHTPGEWSDDASIRITWTDEGYDATSGVWGYSWVFDRVADTRPDEDAEQGAGPGDLIDLWAIPDGDWYFHFMTRDRAGNWVDPVHLGPYRIDTADPVTPTLDWSIPEIDAWIDGTVRVMWETTDTDIAGYSYAWNPVSTYYVDDTIETTDPFANSGALSSGWWYLHVRAIDGAGNGSPIAHFGPFGVDSADPYGCWINVPRYSNSDTCVVEWHYIDPDSGIASYDVQVRDDTYGVGTWEDWLLATTATSTLYPDAGLGTFTFRVRARDEAGNLSDYACEDQTIIDDLGAQEIEVTQVTQNLANDVTLIGGKTTYARFYVRSSLVDVSSVDARLYGTRGGAALPGSPLRPTGGRITVRGDGGERVNLDDAFYFLLPSTWRSGTVEFRAVVDPWDEITEEETFGNESTETVTFQSADGFCIVFVPVHLHPNTYYIDDHRSDFWDMVDLARWFYPTSDTGIGIYSSRTMYPSSHGAGWEYGLPSDYDRVLSDLWWYNFWTTNPCHETHYFGMVDPISQSDGAMGMGYRPGHHAAGVMTVSRGSGWPEPVGGRVLAHELGHNFGREHVWCTGCEEEGGDIDDSYPYEEAIRHTCDTTTTYTCRFGPDSTIEYYGFWPYTGGEPEIIPPLDYGDLMSYYSRRWPSDYTYEALRDAIADAALAQTTLPLSKAWTEAAEYLLVGGLITPTTQSAEFRPFYRMVEPPLDVIANSYEQELATAAATNVYSLTLEDAGGGVLYTHTFSAAVNSDLNPAPLTAIFAEALPYNSVTARVVLKQGTVELASRLVSAHAPTVTLLSPNGGETVSDHLSLVWSGSDADGDDLFYTVQYSPDDGANWYILRVDFPDTAYDVAVEDLLALPGSESARVRVTVTDGVHVASDESDTTFSVSRKAPRAYIIAPDSGSEFAFGETIILRGAALDTEDGPLDDTAPLTWTTHLSGTLGTGAELWVSDLVTGAHRITLFVTDSNGQTGTDEIFIFVGMSPLRVYLPVVLRQ